MDDNLLARTVAEVMGKPGAHSQYHTSDDSGVCDCQRCFDCLEDEIDTIQKMVECGADRIEACPSATPLTRDRPITDIARFIDHTLLKPEATKSEIIKLCSEAAEYGFASVCINPSFVPLCREELTGTDVMVCTVVGFPLGAVKTESKVFETKRAIDDGAQEIDMVIHIGALKTELYRYVEDDIRSVVQAAAGNTVKVIIEACLLTNEEKIKASILASRAGAHFVKTSTGFSKGGATLEDVLLMKKVVGENIGVKAAGGVKSYEDAKKMIASGATRLGASAGIKIVQGLAGQSNY